MLVIGSESSIVLDKTQSTKLTFPDDSIIAVIIQEPIQQIMNYNCNAGAVGSRLLRFYKEDFLKTHSATTQSVVNFYNAGVVTDHRRIGPRG
jgi:hypothetical protein